MPGHAQTLALTLSIAYILRDCRTVGSELVSVVGAELSVASVCLCAACEQNELRLSSVVLRS